MAELTMLEIEMSNYTGQWWAGHLRSKEAIRWAEDFLERAV